MEYAVWWRKFDKVNKIRSDKTWCPYSCHGTKRNTEERIFTCLINTGDTKTC